MFSERMTISLGHNAFSEGITVSPSRITFNERMTSCGHGTFSKGMNVSFNHDIFKKE